MGSLEDQALRAEPRQPAIAAGRARPLKFIIWALNGPPHTPDPPPKSENPPPGPAKKGMKSSPLIHVLA